MTGEDTVREEGVEFTDLEPIFEEISYPIATEEFVNQYGMHAIERTNAEPITVRELYDGMGEETFESAEDLRKSILNFMPRESVGRSRYSDRGGQTHEERARNDESL